MPEDGLPHAIPHSSTLVATALLVHRLEGFRVIYRRPYSPDAVLIKVFIEVLEPHHLARKGFAVLSRFEKLPLFEENRAVQDDAPYLGVLGRNELRGVTVRVLRGPCDQFHQINNAVALAESVPRLPRRHVLVVAEITVAADLPEWGFEKEIESVALFKPAYVPRGRGPEVYLRRGRLPAQELEPVQVGRCDRDHVPKPLILLALRSTTATRLADTRCTLRPCP